MRPALTQGPARLINAKDHATIGAGDKRSTGCPGVHSWAATRNQATAGQLMGAGSHSKREVTGFSGKRGKTVTPTVDGVSEVRLKINH